MINYETRYKQAVLTAAEQVVIALMYATDEDGLVVNREFDPDTVIYEVEKLIEGLAAVKKGAKH